MSNLHVIKPGWQSTIQDGGRRGYFRDGLSEGGAMDEHAYHWANTLLENDLDSACIEILMGQFEAVFDADTTIAITGADLDARINGREVKHWSTHPVKAGDRIAFKQPRNGLRAYLAVAGGWQTPVLFGSRSVVMRERLGGLDGGPLRAEDRLSYLPNLNAPRRCVAPNYIPDYQAELTLKVVPGYQYRDFSNASRLRFTTSEYRVSNRIDRMGYKLEGPAISTEQSGVISEGIALGAIQIPQDGNPIVLMRDRQTIGGYPKIGCVTSLDCSRLSQRGPGAVVSFEFSDIATVQADRQIFDRFFRASSRSPSGQPLN